MKLSRIPQLRSMSKGQFTPHQQRLRSFLWCAVIWWLSALICVCRCSVNWPEAKLYLFSPQIRFKISFINFWVYIKHKVHVVATSINCIFIYPKLITWRSSLVPLHRGGLETGDIIVKLNGHPLVNTGELQEAIQEDTPLLLEVRRGNDDLLFNIEPRILMQWQWERCGTRGIWRTRSSGADW